MANKKPTQVMTPEFRVSFPNVFRPQAIEEGKDPKYGITMLFPKGADLSELKAAAKAAATEKWGTDQSKWPQNLRLPFRDQGEKSFAGYEPGAVFINATTKQKPGLVDAQVQPIIDESEFYPGCYARATVTAFAYDQKGNRGVAFGLNNIQKLRDGERLAGAPKPEDEFTPVAAPEGGTAGDVFDAPAPASTDDPFA